MNKEIKEIKELGGIKHVIEKLHDYYGTWEEVEYELNIGISSIKNYRNGIIPSIRHQNKILEVHNKTLTY